MNRTRCPWCGKKIDRNKDKIRWEDVVDKRVTPEYLRQANCSHCGHKYRQVPVMRYVLAILAVVLFLVVLALIVQSVMLLLASVLPFFLLLRMPYSKLDDTGKPSEVSGDLLCEITILEKLGKIRRDDLYFLDAGFDGFEPFTHASPICVYEASKKSNTVFGEFLYRNEQNFAYMEREFCVLYDTEMNPVAKIRLAADTDAG